jgi:hypothetical protein
MTIVIYEVYRQSERYKTAIQVLYIKNFRCSIAGGGRKSFSVHDRGWIKRDYGKKIISAQKEFAHNCPNN